MKDSFARAAKLNASDFLGMSLFLYAVDAGKTEEVFEMIAQGAEVNQRAKGANIIGRAMAFTGHAKTYPQNTTPLHIAAINGYSALAQMLIEKKADIQARDINGETPLDYALGAWYHHNNRLIEKMRRSLVMKSTQRKIEGQLLRCEEIIKVLLVMGALPQRYDLPPSLKAKFFPEQPPSPKAPGPE